MMSDINPSSQYEWDANLGVLMMLQSVRCSTRHARQAKFGDI